MHALSVTLCMQCTLKWIVKYDVLFSQFQQHGVIKELVNGDILTEALYEGKEKREMVRIGERLPSTRA